MRAFELLDYITNNAKFFFHREKCFNSENIEMRKRAILIYVGIKQQLARNGLKQYL